MSSSTTHRSLAPRPSPNRTPSQTTTAYLTYPVSHVVSGLYRRLTEPSPSPPTSRSQSQSHNHSMASSHSHDNIYTPPIRTHSPFQPPPLTPLTLHGILPTTPSPALILSATHLASSSSRTGPSPTAWSKTASLSQPSTKSVPSTKTYTTASCWSCGTGWEAHSAPS